MNDNVEEFELKSYDQFIDKIERLEKIQMLLQSFSNDEITQHDRAIEKQNQENMREAEYNANQLRNVMRLLENYEKETSVGLKKSLKLSQERKQIVETEDIEDELEVEIKTFGQRKLSE